MSATKKFLTAVGFAKAPRATLFLKKPAQVASAWVAWAAAKKAAPRNSKTVIAAVGTAVAAAVVAPLAIKAMRESSTT